MDTDMPSSLPESLQNPERLAALRHTALLDSAPEAAFDRLTRLASTVLGAPVALISLVDEDRQFFKSCIGLPEPWATERETPLSHSFCQHTVFTREPLVVTDAREHPLVHTNLAIPDLGVIAYAGVPLITSEGYVLGTLCVIDDQPRAWGDEALAILTDLAALVMTEIEARAAVRKAEAHAQRAKEAIELRDIFLSIATHELRAPLTSIHGHATLLQRRLPTDKLGERNQNSLSIILEQARQLNSLIEQLADVSQLEMGQVQLDLAPLDLKALVQRRLEDMQTLAERHTFAFACSEQALSVRGDTVRLEQVVRNLLQNAVKYSPNGGTIAVRLSQCGEQVQLSISDEGLGIPATALPRLFQRFYRASNAEGSSIKGAGLGLYIVREILALHKGTIEVTSQEGTGSTFTIRLPLHQL